MNILSKAIASTYMVAFLSACGPDPTMQMGKIAPVGPVVSNESSSNVGCTVEVNRFGVFEDELAYNGKRGLYRLVDHCTGKEYIGISGVGISEAGSHMAGKVRVEDEK